MNEQETITDPTAYIEQSGMWDADKEARIVRSENRAWKVAAGLGVCVLALTGAIVAMLPLKTVEPYVITSDRITGVPTIATLMTEKTIDADEALNKFWINAYMQHRERYFFDFIAEDYATVGLMSTQTVADEYALQFAGETARHEVLKDNYIIKVSVLSIVLHTASSSATVRFNTQKIETKSQRVIEDTTQVATLAFEYQNVKRMEELDRLVSPFGFRVTAFTIDPEYIGGAK